jgi:hypothetical protein
VAKDDKVLSQAEIDALLSSSLEKGNAPENKKPTTAPTQQIKVNTVPPPPPKAAAAPIKAPPAPPAKAASAVATAGPAAPAAVPTTAAPVRAATAIATGAAAPAQSVNPGTTTEQMANLCRQVVAQETRDLNKQLIELTIQVNRFEKAAQKMAQIEDKLDQVAATVQSSPKAVRAMGAKIDEIYGLLDAMRRPGRKSDEERIHDEFRCVKCQSEKLVAIHVKCTSCGTENWMGWYPESR